MSVGGKMKKLEDLRFVLTDEMNKMFVEIIIIKQRLEEDITLKEQMVLEKELKILTGRFIKKFRKNNVEQIKEYKELVKQQRALALFFDTKQKTNIKTLENVL